MNQPFVSTRDVLEAGGPHRLNSAVPKMAELIAGEIRLKIVRKELKTGEFLLPEAKLAQLYGVSRPVAREALRLLESERLISVRRGGRHGPEVIAPDIDPIAHSVATLLHYQDTKIADAREAWSAMECMAIWKLVERDGDVDLTPLRNLIVEIRANNSDAEAFVELGLTFSLELISLAKNDTILVMFRLLRNIVTGEIGAVRRQIDPKDAQSLRKDTPDFMEKLLDMIESRDPRAMGFWKDRLDQHSRFHLDILGHDKTIDISSLSF